jgi:hypothetical protein
LKLLKRESTFNSFSVASSSLGRWDSCRTKHAFNSFSVASLVRPYHNPREEVALSILSQLPLLDSDEACGILQCRRLSILSQLPLGISVGHREITAGILFQFFLSCLEQAEEPFIEVWDRAFNSFSVASPLLAAAGAWAAPAIYFFQFFLSCLGTAKSYAVKALSQLVLSILSQLPRPSAPAPVRRRTGGTFNSFSVAS